MMEGARGGGLHQIVNNQLINPAVGQAWPVAGSLAFDLLELSKK
jgi:hypothetical protein